MATNVGRDWPNITRMNCDARVRSGMPTNFPVPFRTRQSIEHRKAVVFTPVTFVAIYFGSSAGRLKTSGMD
ncbi:MAG TPA: hypothetical protein VI424_08315 [Terriglobales bacterium]